MIISSILFAKQNILHPLVITVQNLKNELLKIKLDSNVQFPVPLNKDFQIHNYFSINKISVIYDNFNLIYVIRILLVDTQIFTLYNLIPLPSFSLQHPNGFSYTVCKIQME